MRPHILAGEHQPVAPIDESSRKPDEYPAGYIIFFVVISKFFIQIRLQISDDGHIPQSQPFRHIADAQPFIHMGMNNIRLEFSYRPPAQKNQLYVEPEFSPRKSRSGSFVPADFF